MYTFVWTESQLRRAEELYSQGILYHMRIYSDDPPQGRFVTLVDCEESQVLLLMLL